jgi:hypothetical protein
MAIRVRSVEGVLTALCAAETDPMPGDLYLDDGVHYALASKFARDWRGQTITWVYEEEDRAAETQKLRDAQEELQKWLSEIGPEESGP